MILAQARNEFFRWDWVADNAGAIWERVVEHVYLTSIALAIGLLISLALSVVRLSPAQLVLASGSGDSGAPAPVYTEKEIQLRLTANPFPAD